MSFDLDRLRQANKINNPSTLDVYLDNRFDAYKGGNLKRTAMSIKDQIDSFIYQVATNINNLDKEDRSEFLAKIKVDTMAKLDKVIT